MAKSLNIEPQLAGQNLTWLFATPFLVVFAGVCIWYDLWFDQTSKGPEYLLFYGILFVGMFLLATILRHAWKDTWYISVFAFLTFEAIGGFHIWLKTQAGINTFDFLIAMMVVGGILFFMRAKEEQGYGFFGACGVGGWPGSGGGGGCGGCGGGG